MRVALVIVALFGLLGACSKGDDRLLDALTADPLASLSLPAIEETRRSETPRHEALGKPVYTSVNIRYRIVGSADADAVLAAAVAAAEAWGWDVDESHDGVTVRLYKNLEPGRAVASLALLEIDGEPNLVVILGYEPPQ